MASSDAPSGCEYQVFLSFRGPDTRTGFTDVLFHSLTSAGIRVFRDDEELRVGERIDGSLWRAIDNSRIYIPIFSRTYASSQWCLRELTQIVVNTFKSEGTKEILPIFFDVNPDDVKLKTPLYRDAVLNLEHEKKLSPEQVNAWREALMEVDAIKGWEVKKYKGHGELINLVVEEVVKKLKTKHRSVTEHLVGIDDRVVAVSKLLDVNSGGVRLVQIYGMGGIGKTTLAKVVFNQLSSDFGKYCCFLEDVRAKSSRDVDLIELQKKLLSEIGHPAGTRSIDEINYGMKRIEEVLHNKKVLLVLDDVDNYEQVEKFVGKSPLYSGSRILITTRNKDVLQIHRPKEYQMLEYEMELMSSDHAFQLFSKHAFDRDSPSDEYKELSREIVYATGRLPLALEVIGSLLYNKKKQEQWKKTLKELRRAPHDGVFGKLRISYDALSFEQQQIFLDIACFFIGENRANAIYMWEDCELLQDDGVDVLHSMCLIKIVENKFWMHDQLRDFGREIVRKENHMNPEKRSRLWIHKDIVDTITTKKKKKNVQTLDIDLRRSRVKDIKSEEIGRFENLRCLKLNGGTFVGNLAVCLTKLRWIFWSHPPRMSNSTNVHFKNVVVLRISYHDFMDDSKLQSLIETAIKLKVLSVESCPRITKTPKFSGYLNLERLTFTNCSNLRRIDDSIGKLKCLIKLKIDMCNHLEDLPEELGDLVNLEHFFVKGLEVKKLPDSIWKLKSLRKLRFFGIKNFYLTSFWELPSAIRMLQNLEVLIINTSNLGGQLPSEIGSLPSLKILDLSFTSVSGVPKTVGMLPRLQRLELRLCNEIQELPALPTSLTHLLASSISLRVVPDLSNLANLVELNLNEEGGRGCCTGELRGFGRLSKLTKLSLGLCNVPATELASLHLLKELHLFGLDQETFPQLPLSLQKLSLNNFNSAASIFPNLRDLLSLELYNCPMQEFQLDGLQLPHLRDFTVQCCGRLKRFRLSNMTKLTCFAVRACPKLAEIQFSWPFELLEHLCLSGCESLERLVYVGEAADDDDESVKEMITCEGRLVLASEALRKLRVFELAACHKILEIHVVGTSESWEVFHVWNHPLLQGIRGLPNLKNLRSLSAHFCAGLEVVEGLDELEFLNLLSVRGCQSLERLIDKSTTRLPNDCHLDISGCEKLREARRGFEGSVTYFKHHKEQQQELKPSRGVSLQPVQEQEQELESHLHQEQEREQELEPSGRVTSQPEQEQEQESHLHEEQEREEEQESHLKQEQQQESHSKQEQEQELKQRRRPGGVSFKCPSFTSSSLCCFHDGNRRGPSFKEVRGRSPSSHKEDG
ncbi:disease resistance protein L6-like isoform X1 [Rhodamnia argentea]|uniref:Disease resistance protein L6-like isoform X1 n=1 Tax=Rhodamnia argentea TaxID=178133 RepID=A0ABM3HXE2_9MYRT|nr:disease resistance protein L6-like isoform X1 [Rhodamnia argentea]